MVACDERATRMSLSGSRVSAFRARAAWSDAAAMRAGRLTCAAGVVARSVCVAEGSCGPSQVAYAAPQARRKAVEAGLVRDALILRASRETFVG